MRNFIKKYLNIKLFCISVFLFVFFVPTISFYNFFPNPKNLEIYHFARVQASGPAEPVNPGDGDETGGITEPEGEGNNSTQAPQATPTPTHAGKTKLPDAAFNPTQILIIYFGMSLMVLGLSTLVLRQQEIQ